MILTTEQMKQWIDETWTECQRQAWRETEMKDELLNPIRVRIMCEAYDLADRGDSEGYNAVKVMGSDVLAMIKELIAAEREACAQVAERQLIGRTIAKAIRARGEK
jgi:hypothetical protein